MMASGLIIFLAAVVAISPCNCKICGPGKHNCIAKACVRRDADPPQAKYRHNGPALLPDPKYTPGAIIKGENPCAPGFKASSVRNVTEAEKKQVYAEYGAREKPGVCCEVDHLISLELGGSNEITNLWPQPYEPTPGAHEKDKLEDYLHRQVCSGKMSLKDAQHEISTDWYGAMKRYMGSQQ